MSKSIASQPASWAKLAAALGIVIQFAFPGAAWCADVEEERVAPFWRLGAGFETRLMINNTQAAPRTVRFDMTPMGGAFLRGR